MNDEPTKSSIAKRLSQWGRSIQQGLEESINTAPQHVLNTEVNSGRATFPTLSLDRAWRDQTLLRAQIEAWAASSAVNLQWPDAYVRPPSEQDLTKAYAIETSPCVDFGKVTERIPGFVVYPEGEGQLVEAVRFLVEHEIPFKIRGAGHSSGGQTLISHGAVVDMRGVAGIFDDDPERQLIRVAGGTPWLDVAKHLQEQGRQPHVLTGQLLTTVAGTLSVGGFASTSARWGVQAASVARMRVLTLDGTIHDVGPGNDLFDFTLAGRGQLGILVDATIRTLPRSNILQGWALSWGTVAEYVKDVQRIIDEERFEHVIAHYTWDETRQVAGSVGIFSAYQSPSPSEIEDLAAKVVQKLELDAARVRFERSTHNRGADRYWPCLEFILPLPHGLGTWQHIEAYLRANNYHRMLTRSTYLLVLRCDSRLPLAPFPESL